MEEQLKKVEENAIAILDSMDNGFTFAEIEDTLLRAIELAKYRCKHINPSSVS